MGIPNFSTSTPSRHSISILKPINANVGLWSAIVKYNESIERGEGAVNPRTELVNFFAASLPSLNWILPTLGNSTLLIRDKSHGNKAITGIAKDNASLENRVNANLFTKLIIAATVIVAR